MGLLNNLINITPDGITTSNVSWSVAAPTRRYYLVSCIFCSEPFVCRDDSVFYYHQNPRCMSRNCPHCKTEIILCLEKCNDECENRAKCLVNGFIEFCLSREIKVAGDDDVYAPSYHPMIPPTYGDNIRYYYTDSTTPIIGYSSP